MFVVGTRVTMPGSGRAGRVSRILDQEERQQWGVPRDYEVIWEEWPDHDPLNDCEDGNCCFTYNANSLEILT